MSVPTNQMNPLTISDTSLEILLNAANNANGSLDLSEDVLLSHEDNVKLLTAIIHNKNITSVHTSFWKMDPNHFSHVIKTLKEMVALERPSYYCNWDFMRHTAHGQWNTQEKETFMKNYMTMQSIMLSSDNVLFPFTVSVQESQQWFEQFLETYPEQIHKVFMWISKCDLAFKEQSEHNYLIEWFYTAIVKQASNKGWINFIQLPFGMVPLNKNHIVCILNILSKCPTEQSISLNINLDLSADQDTLTSYEYLSRELKVIKNLGISVTFTNTDHLLNNPNLQKIIKDICMNNSVTSTACMTVDLSLIKDTLEQYRSMFSDIFGEKYFNINITFKNMDPFKVEKINYFIKFICSLGNITYVKLLEEVNNEQLFDIKELEEISAYIKKNVSLRFNSTVGFYLEKNISLFPNNKLMKMSESNLENDPALQLKLYAIKLGLTTGIEAPNTLLGSSEQYKSIFSEFINTYPKKIEMLYQLFGLSRTANFNIDHQQGLKINAFQLDPHFVQKLFIMLCEKQILTNKKIQWFAWEKFTQCDHYGLKFTNPFFTPWKGFYVPSPNEELYGLSGCPSDSEEEEVDSKIKHQEFMICKTIIPAFKETSKLIWKDNLFYLPSLNKIEARIKKYEPTDHNLAELTKCEHLLKWYTWINVYLMHTDEHLLIDLQSYKNVFKEMVDYSDSQIRNIITQTFFNNVLKNELGKKIYPTLTASQKNSINCLIPAIFLTKIIIDNQKEIERKEAEEQNLVHMSIEILSLIPRQYKDGHYGQVFIAALLCIFDTDELTPYQKLTLLINIFKSSPVKEKIEKAILVYFNSLKPKMGIVKITPMLIKDELIKLLAEHNDALLNTVAMDAIKPFCKENKKTNEVDDLTKKDINALSRTIIDNMHLLYHLAELKDQREIWILIQGLSLLKEFKHLKEVPVQQLKAAIKNIFAKLFELNAQNMQFYPQAFGGKRNEGALLTYLGKIRQLHAAESTEVLDLFKQFIRSVLSENSQTFYQQRYDEHLPCHAHLKTIWSSYPDLKDRWIKNHEEDLTHYLEEKKITFKPFKPDYVKFIYTKIFEHQHLKGDGYSDLKEYLECELFLKDPKSKIDQEANEILEQKKAMIKLKFKQTSSNPEMDKLSKIKVELALSLITFIDLATGEENAERQRAAIGVIMRHLTNPELNAGVLLNDFHALIKGLQNNKLALSLKEKQNHRIVFTDNYWDLFMCGTDVLGSCQRVDGDPDLNKCLISYLLSGKNKYLCVQDASGKAVGRCFIRLLWDNTSQTPVLYREEFYPNLLASEYQQALSLFAEDLSDYMGIPLVSSESTENSKIYPNILMSLSGVGPEYVDALHTQVEEGIFEISTAQLIHQPVICLQRRISPSLDLEMEQAPPPLLILGSPKPPEASSQLLDLDLPPISSDLAGHEPVKFRVH